MAETEFSDVRFKGDRERAAAVSQGCQPLTVAEAVHWVAAQPSHVNINAIEMMPTSQAWDHLQVARNGDKSS